MFSFAHASPCRALPADVVAEEKFNEEEADLSGETEVKEGEHLYFPRLWCEEGQYSIYGQLLMVQLSESLRMIVHLGETVDCATTGCQSDIFPSSSLFVFLVVVFLLMTLTYGVSAPTGLFVPSLAVGASMGHLVGQIVQVRPFSSRQVTRRTLCLTSCSPLSSNNPERCGTGQDHDQHAHVQHPWGRGKPGWCDSDDPLNRCARDGDYRSHAAHRSHNARDLCLENRGRLFQRG